MERPIKNKRAYETLASWVRGQRLPHAVLLEGPEGPERDAFALEIARAAMCADKANPGAAECSCRHCVKIRKGVHPDLDFFSGEGRARSFHINTIRDIRGRAYIYPNEADMKVFVLRNTQDMSPQAQNALLKILEEPPGSVIFILTCENKSSMLETVLSRVTVVSLESRAEGAHDEKGAENGLSSGHEAAGNILAALLSRKELDALAALGGYERDRQGFIEVLLLMREQAEGELLRPYESGIKADGKALFLERIIEGIDEAVYLASANAGVSLLGCVLCAKIMDDRRIERN